LGAGESTSVPVLEPEFVITAVMLTLPVNPTIATIWLVASSVSLFLLSETKSFVVTWFDIDIGVFEGGVCETPTEWKDRNRWEEGVDHA